MTQLIRIGNSQGIRIPKTLVEQAGLEDVRLELEVVQDGLLIKPVKKARQGWREAYEAAKDRVTYDSEWLEAELNKVED
jgi:antitoxin MazE